MDLLGLDIGSSSVKAAILRNGKVRGRIVRAAFETRHAGVCVEVSPDSLLRAVKNAIRNLGKAARFAEQIALSVMSPAWVAMDARGKALTPIITHQDRRSAALAIELEKRVGKDRFLQLAGNRPVPGGISATTWEWFLQHKPQALRRADLVGHLNTFLHRQLTGARVIDPSNASFTGLYNTIEQSGWNDQLCDAVGVSMHLLPQIMEANQIGGRIISRASDVFGLREGTPVFVGLIDTSSAMLLTGAKTGQLINTCGSTDVLGLCTDRPIPHEKLLTRALGVGCKWMSVSTIAAAGSSLTWMHDQLFSEMPDKKFWQLVDRLAREGKRARKSEENGIRFDPYLAGERTSVEQRKAAFTGLTLSTTRQQLLEAVIESLAQASAARIDLFTQLGVPMRRRVMVTGGAKSGLAALSHRDWKGKWSFYEEEEATLRGLAMLESER